MGWNVAFNDDDEGGNRKLQLNWSGQPHSEFTYGFLTLGPLTGGDVCDPNSAGDLDGDGSVAFADFLVLSANFGTEVTSHADGDIDCNGTVDFADFLVLSANFGQAVGAESVPEPASSVTLCLAGLLIAHLRPRRHRK